MSPSSEPQPVVVDEVWFREWVAFGMLELSVYLTKHADFLDYCERRSRRRPQAPAGYRSSRVAPSPARRPP